MSHGVPGRPGGRVWRAADVRFCRSCVTRESPHAASEVREVFERKRRLRQRFHRDADQQQLVVVRGHRPGLETIATGASMDQHPVAVALHGDAIGWVRASHRPCLPARQFGQCVRGTASGVVTHTVSPQRTHVKVDRREIGVPLWDTGNSSVRSTGRQRLPSVVDPAEGSHRTGDPMSGSDHRPERFAGSRRSSAAVRGIIHHFHTGRDRPTCRMRETLGRAHAPRNRITEWRRRPHRTRSHPPRTTTGARRGSHCRATTSAGRSDAPPAARPPTP